MLILISGCVIIRICLMNMKTMKMVEDDDDFLFWRPLSLQCHNLSTCVSATKALYIDGTEMFTSDSTENCRRPKGQPDGRRLKGQPTWAQASTQILYARGNGQANAIKADMNFPAFGLLRLPRLYSEVPACPKPFRRP